MKKLIHVKIKFSSKIWISLWFIAKKGIDFSQFSCGNFIKNQQIPDDSSSHDTFTILGTSLPKQIASKY